MLGGFSQAFSYPSREFDSGRDGDEQQQGTDMIGPESVKKRYRRVRDTTMSLTEHLSEEDQAIQSMADVSPTKWHLAHTTWFFETFLLRDHVQGYGAFDKRYHFLFNSYYEAEGPRHARPARGLLSRPGLPEIHRYREHVDAAMLEFIDKRIGVEADSSVSALLELGLHHEQQHQELILADIKHVLSCNPLRPAYSRSPGG